MWPRSIVGVARRGNRSLDHIEHSVDVAEHVMIPEAQYEEASRLKRDRPNVLTFPPRIVLAPIHLYDQFRLV